MRRPIFLCGVALLMAGCPAKPPTAGRAEDAGAATPKVTEVAPPAPVAQEPELVAPPPVNIHLGIHTSPRTHARVFWGKKLLGNAPLDFERPQNSGPLDLVVRADSYLPVHTRLYTIKSNTLSVELTRPADKQTLLGAKKEPSPDETGPVPSDGGVTK